MSNGAYGQILSLDSRVQYLDSCVAPFLSSKKGYKFTKSMRKQIKPIEFTPLAWIDNEEDLTTAVSEIQECISRSCKAVAVDLEYHCVERRAIILCLI